MAGDCVPINVPMVSTSRNKATRYLEDTEKRRRRGVPENPTLGRLTLESVEGAFRTCQGTPGRGGLQLGSGGRASGEQSAQGGVASHVKNLSPRAFLKDQRAARVGESASSRGHSSCYLKTESNSARLTPGGSPRNADAVLKNPLCSVGVLGGKNTVRVTRAIKKKPPLLSS